MKTLTITDDAINRAYLSIRYTPVVLWCGFLLWWQPRYWVRIWLFHRHLDWVRLRRMVRDI